MTRAAITVENLSKAYHIGLREDRADTLVGAVHGLVRKPLAHLRHMRRMNTFKHQEDAEDIYWALKDVSFEVAEGEVVGIIGRNGAGKSTLLKILSRITEPTSGRATIRGRVSSLLEVGTGFHPELSGRENVYMNGTILGMTSQEIDRKFDEIVDFSGVDKFLDTPIKHYSSGMKVRLAFSVAAHLEPEILIIDEVLAVGDAEFQKKCLGKMQDVARCGRTALFVSHNMAAVESLCSRAIVMSGGRCSATGPTESVVNAYLTDLVKSKTGKDGNAFTNSEFIRDATLLDVAGSRTETVPVGGSFKIKITIHSPFDLQRPQFGIGFDSMFGQRVLTIMTPAVGSPVQILKGTTYLSCHLPTMPLAPGTYMLRLVLRESLQELDAIDSALTVTVTNSDIFKEGRGFTSGLCVARSHWSSITSDSLENSDFSITVSEPSGNSHTGNY